MKHWNKKSYAGLALLAALLWMLPAQLAADTTTQKKSTSTVKPKPHTSSTHSTRSTHSTHSTQSTHSTRKPAAHTGQHQSAHHPASRHVSSKARQAADRRRRARMRPEPERIQEIQQALVKAGYLNAEPSGRWDDQTREAMRRYQADHGFPTTGLPEAKSLMKLGLGPHPLPADVDSSNEAKAGADTVSNTAPPPNAPQNPPATTTPQP